MCHGSNRRIRSGKGFFVVLPIPAREADVLQDAQLVHRQADEQKAHQNRGGGRIAELQVHEGVVPNLQADGIRRIVRPAARLHKNRLHNLERPDRRAHEIDNDKGHQCRYRDAPDFREKACPVQVGGFVHLIGDALQCGEIDDTSRPRPGPHQRYDDREHRLIRVLQPLLRPHRPKPIRQRPEY
jgi:hypothetical protein